ncbi:MAG: tripartite tricarboxylate transporter permease [Clostridium sp.]|nr:tripartite tricarboxylate transporter permease [Clostridium sp.]
MEYIITILTPYNLFMSLLGTIVGIIFGALPGLTATMGVAVFLPFTFGMTPVTAFAFLLGIYCGGVFGGSITAILIKTPGTAASAATVLDGYPMAQSGHAYRALAWAALASFCGGIFSCVCLILFAPLLAKVALKFGAPEYFAVGLFGLSIVSCISGQHLMKGLFSTCVGLMIAMIGMDPIVGTSRFTFGNVNMMSGVSMIAALVGLFGLGEVFNKLEAGGGDGIAQRIHVKKEKIEFRELVKHGVTILRSAVIGTVVGVIPATGPGIASWLSYNEARRASKHPELLGTGTVEGLAASEAANNAVTGGALIPLLTLGIPGDPVTAVLMGALIMQGLPTGAKLFTEKGEVVTGIYVMLMIANIFMVLCGLLLINVFMRVLLVPTKVLMPCVMTLTFLGAYCIRSNVFDVRVALILGIIAFLFQKTDYPLPPMLLGIVLCSMIETNYRRSLLISKGNPAIFLQRPICLIFLLISAATFIMTVIRQRKSRKAA